MTMIINLFSKDKTVSNSKMNIILLVVILNIQNIHIVTSQKSKQQIFIGTEYEYLKDDDDYQLIFKRQSH